MPNHINQLAEQLLRKSFEELEEREKRVLKHVAEKLHISRNTSQEFLDNYTFGQWLADKVAAFGGSWSFIILFGGVMFVWIGLNTLVLSGKVAFDPYPFIFLNFILSMLAALQAPVIMMSQNRQS